jgi:plasmid stabilization system protein ParE
MSREAEFVNILPYAFHAMIKQARYYASVSESDLDIRWRRAVDDAIAFLQTTPEGGSRFFFAEPRLADLRRWPIAGFPSHLIVYKYLPESDTLVIVDVTHGAVDLRGRLLSALDSEPTRDT